MKIAWFCIPAQGHTNPTLGLVRYVVEAGHQVTYFSFERFRQAIQATGAQFVACDDYGDFDLGLDERESSDRSGKDLAFATHLLVQSTLALEGPARGLERTPTGSSCGGLDGNLGQALG